MDEDELVVIRYDDAADHSDALRHKYLPHIDRFIDNISEELWIINKHIYDNPELGYEEHKAHALLTDFMKSRSGWMVTPSAYGMATAWVATYDSGAIGPVVSFNVEMGTFSTRPFEGLLLNIRQMPSPVSATPVGITSSPQLHLPPASRQPRW